jgi:GntR family transcriptional regulator
VAGLPGDRAAGVAPATRRKASPRTDAAEAELRRWLVQRQHRAGDRLPADVDLARMLGVARSTVIAALDRLEDDGLIVRRQGSGTFVLRTLLPPGAHAGLEVLESLGGSARRQGLPLDVAEVTVERDAPLPAGVAGILRVGAGVPATRVRVVLAGPRGPVALAVDRLHPDLPVPEPGALAARVRGGELPLDILVADGVPLAYGQTSIRSRIVQPHDEPGRVLGVRAATAATELVETAHLASGAAVTHTCTTLLADAVDLHVFRHMEVSRAECPRAVAPGTRDGA